MPLRCILAVIACVFIELWSGVLENIYLSFVYNDHPVFSVLLLLLALGLFIGWKKLCSTYVKLHGALKTGLESLHTLPVPKKKRSRSAPSASAPVVSVSTTVATAPAAEPDHHATY